MRHLRDATLALVALGGSALIGSAASAQAPYGYNGPPAYGSYNSYGAARQNPSIAPNGWYQDSGRDFQLTGRD